LNGLAQKFSALKLLQGDNGGIREKLGLHTPTRKINRLVQSLVGLCLSSVTQRAGKREAQPRILETEVALGTSGLHVGISRI